MKKLAVKSALVVAAASAAILASAPAAQATGPMLWAEYNYQGSAVYGVTAYYVGDGMHDRGSSIKNYGYCIHVYENAGYGGRYAHSCDYYNDLRAVTDNLGWFETWNDRIDSWK